MEKVPIHDHSRMVSLQIVLVDGLAEDESFHPLVETYFSGWPRTQDIIVKDKFGCYEVVFSGSYFIKSVICGVEYILVGLNHRPLTLIIQKLRVELFHLDTDYVFIKVLHRLLPRFTRLTLLRSCFCVT